MIRLFASAAALAIFISAAAAQTPSPPPAIDQANPNDEGPAGGPPPPPAGRAGLRDDEGPRARPRPPGPPPGAHVKIDFGRGKGIDVRCDDREPFKACVDAAMAVLDKAMPAMRAEAPPPPPPGRDRDRGRDRDEDRGWDSGRMPMQEGRMGMMAPDTMNYMRSMHDMMREMGDSNFTGDPSQDFATIMIPYNRGAVAMAESLLKNRSSDPQMQMLARKMIQEQADNADQLEDWLQARQRQTQ